MFELYRYTAFVFKYWEVIDLSYFSKEDKQILKPLLEKAAELAASKKNEIKRKRWHDVNEHIKPDSPPIYMKLMPSSWQTLIPDKSIKCKSKEAKELELFLKQHFRLYEFDDDTPIHNKLFCTSAFDVSPPNIWGVKIKRVNPSKKQGAFKIDPPLKSPKDFDSLTIPEFTYNEQKTKEKIDKLSELSQGIFEVEETAKPPINAILSGKAGQLRGMGELMLDMATAPKLVHRLMKYLMNAHLSAMKAVGNNNLVEPGPKLPWYECEYFGPEPVDGKYSFKNCWVRMHGQEFDQVSPKMWDEFLIPYQKRIAEKYGKVEYGCCESLTNRIDMVLKRIPNLAMIICSIFSDMDKIIDAVGDKYVIQWRQHPTHLFFSEDMSIIENTLREGFEKLKGCHFQIAIREVPSINNNPDRLSRFSAMVREFSSRLM